MDKEAIEEAIEVLEDASAEMLAETGDENYYSEAIAVLRQALKQEPVAWMHNVIEGNVITHIPADIGRHPERWTPLYTAPCQTCQSLAMAVMNDQTYHEKVIPKREWVGLTLNEAEDFYEKYTDRAELINAIDKFLEEKNHG